ncbi:MAG: ATP-binding protein [Deltaproteobacteria bacterium]|nr:ATP-binding protein [Deltaproteobacteria bacterium]
MPAVLVVDTYELLGALDAWVREDFLPSLPDGVVVVIASREPPTAWRLDPEADRARRARRAAKPDPDQSRELLALRGVEGQRRAALGDAAHGHPLALALVAELPNERVAADFALDQAPDVVQALLDCFVRTVPSSEHARALQVAALVQRTTEDLLRAVCDPARAGELFAWLRSLSFVQRGPRGLFPHDIARDVLLAEARTRDPATHLALRRAVRDHLHTRLAAETDRGDQRFTVHELLFLFRQNPVMQRVVDFQRLGTATPEPLRPDDVDAVAAMVEVRVGRETAAVVRRWGARDLRLFRVYRDQEGVVEAVSLDLELDAQSLDETAAFDPIVAAVRDHVNARAGLRAGDRITVGRVFAHRTGGTASAPSVNDMMVRQLVGWMIGPPVAWSFITLHDRSLWTIPLVYMGMERAEIPGETDGRRLHFVIYDWRRLSRRAWLDLTAERETATTTEESPSVAAPEPALVVLSEPDFRASVRAALKDFARDDALGRNALLRSRLVRDASDGQRPVSRLRALMRDAAQSLCAHPRDEKLYRVLHATYLAPAETQELAAERLGLPFSTYRRHLGSAIERVADWLWQREITG